MGFNDLRKKNVSPNGGDLVSISDPSTTFGEILVATLHPAAQGDFVYNANEQIFNTTQFAGGSLVVQDGMAVLNSGTNPSGSAVVQLRRGLKYRPGQGSLMRATALYGNPEPGNAQFVGVGNAECGYFIGYFGGFFGVLHSVSGSREIRSYQVTGPVATTSIDVTLDGDTVSIPVTGGSNVYRTAYELARGDYSQVANGGWIADVIGDTVYYISARSGPANGSYSVVGSTITGTFSSVQAGEAQENIFIPSGSFNIDKLDGTGPTGVVLNPQMGNVYQIGFQYLGFGNARFGMEDPETGRFFNFHQIKNANNRTAPVLRNPNVNILATSANIGGTTSSSMKTVSMAGYTEGLIRNLDPKFSKTINFTNLGTSFKVIAVLKANRVFLNRSSFGEFDLLKIGASNEATGKTLQVSLFLNEVISDAVNFVNIDENNSIVSVAIGSLTFSPSGAPFYNIIAGPNSAEFHEFKEFDFVFGPGQQVIVAAKFSNGTGNGAISLSWFEQQ